MKNIHVVAGNVTLIFLVSKKKVVKIRYINTEDLSIFLCYKYTWYFNAKPDKYIQVVGYRSETLARFLTNCPKERVVINIDPRPFKQ